MLSATFRDISFKVHVHTLLTLINCRCFFFFNYCV